MQNHPAWPSIKNLLASPAPENLELALTLAQGLDLDLQPFAQALLALIQQGQYFPKIRLDATKRWESVFWLARQLIAFTLERGPMPEQEDLWLCFTQLRILELDELEMQHLPRAVCELKELRSLTLSRNRLESLPETLGQLHKLSSLFLDYNPLAVLPSCFTQLQQLQTLKLSHTHFTHLPKELEQLPQLQRLILDKVNHLDLPDLANEWERPHLIIEYE